MEFGLRQDKGVAGLTILLSLVTMLFVIGLLVMIFSLMGGSLRDASFTSTSTTAVNESGARASIVGAGLTLDADALQDGTCGSITAVYNGTAGVPIAVGNFTQVGCLITNATSMATFTATNFLISYPYTYNAENTATGVINDTTAGISGVTDWYDIFIVIGAMVVLILLTVLIITAIRGSGLMMESGKGSGNLGSA